MLTIAKAVGVLLTPPGIIVVLVVLGLLLQSRWRYFGTALLWGSVLALFVLSLPVTGYFLLHTLEGSVEPLSMTDTSLRERAQAIVVLGGGRADDAPEYGGDTVNDYTLERLRYAARLHRATGLPLLVTGGSVFGEPVSEAELMQESLVRDFQVRAAWVESRSRTTYENAVYSRAILEAAGIRRVFLVTHARHIPRALWAFRQAGIEVIAAPTSYSVRGSRTTVLDFLPSMRGLSSSSAAAHEWTGLLWYRLVHGSAQTPASPPGQASIYRSKVSLPV
jgi:uncharacterized SAM-binding protein YcdF (DUF218 family)